MLVSLDVIVEYYLSTMYRQQAAVEALQAEKPTALIGKLILDLSSLASVRKAAEEVCGYLEPIHVCIILYAFPQSLTHKRMRIGVNLECSGTHFRLFPHEGWLRIPIRH